MELIESILRVLAIVGIVAFCWSVCSSLESIAKELKRLADSREPIKPSMPEREAGSGKSVGPA